LAAIATLTSIGVLSISSVVYEGQDASLIALQTMDDKLLQAAENLLPVFENDILTVNNIGSNSADLNEIQIFSDNTHQTMVIRKIFQDGQDQIKNDVLYLFSTSQTIFPSNSVEFTVVDFNQISISGLSGIVKTKLGNSFDISFPDSSSSNSFLSNGTATQNAISVLNGFSINSLIFTIQETGEMIYGVDTIGTAKTIIPYTPVASNTNFAAVILDTDTKNTYAISELSHDYSFDGSSLIDVTETLPNILGYSQTRNIVGSNSVSITNGVVITGTGTTVIELNDYASSRLIMTGTIDGSGGNVKLITELSTDLMTASYGSYGYTIPASFPAMAGLDSTHYGTASWTSGYTYRSQSCAGPVNGYYYVATSYTPYSSSTTTAVTLTETNLANYTSITGATGYSATAPASTGGSVWSWCQKYVNSGIQDGWVSGVTFALYDTLPAYEILDYSVSFVEDLTFESDQTFLYVQPNGGTITILGQNVADTPELVIDNLPASIPYQISKDGWIGVSGVTSSTGNITISEDDVKFEGFATDGGLLHLYPDSLIYVGPFTTICLDTKNEKAFHEKKNSAHF